MKQSRLLYVLLLAGYSCNNPDAAREENLSVVMDTLPAKDSSTDIPLNVQLDSVIHLAFAKDSNALSVRGHLDKRGDPLVCYLPVTQGSRLSASILPDDSLANVRFALVQMPDGSTDGPFSRQLEYKLKQKGVYKLYIRPNMMAGDPAAADFLLRVKVE